MQVKIIHENNIHNSWFDKFIEIFRFIIHYITFLTLAACYIYIFLFLEPKSNFNTPHHQTNHKKPNHLSLW